MELDVKLYNGREGRVHVGKDFRSYGPIYPNYVYFNAVLGQMDCDIDEVKEIDIVDSDIIGYSLELNPYFRYLDTIRFRDSNPIGLLNVVTVGPLRIMGLSSDRLSYCRVNTLTYIDGLEELVRKNPDAIIRFGSFLE